MPQERPGRDSEDEPWYRRVRLLLMVVHVGMAVVRAAHWLWDKLGRPWL